MAHGNDDKQAEFFAAFVRELRSACGTNYKAEMQMHMLADHLAPEDRELLGCLGIDGGQ